MQQIFSNTTLTVNQLIEKIDTGELGLPELQRPFIWKDSKVRDLFDSMMCGYPIGYLMLWECPTLEKKKTIGTDAHNYESPKHVIMDGEQRLTSLYAVIKGKKVVNSKYDEKAIIISYCPLRNKFEVGYQATKKDPEWIYNISEVFTTSNITKLIINFTKKLVEYRASKGVTLNDEEQDLISENITALSNLKQHTLPVFDIKANAEEEDVSEIFVRVNSGGVALKQNDFILTLLSLYWDEGRKEIERFSKESTYPVSYTHLAPHAYLEIVGVMRRGNLHRAGAEFHFNVFIRYDGDLAPHHGDNNRFAHNARITRIRRVYGNCGIAQDGFRARGCHGNGIGAIRCIVAHMPEMAVLLLIFHLSSRKGCFAGGAPVSYTHLDVYKRQLQRCAHKPKKRSVYRHIHMPS